MPHEVLFIQGGGEGAHDEWDNRLVESLHRELGPDYEIRYPPMPHEADPNYALKAAVKEAFGRMKDGAILVGHSIGGTILINALVELRPKTALRGVFLVAAPFIGEQGWQSDEILPMSNLGQRLPMQIPVYVYHGNKDQTAPLEHADLYARAIPHAVVHRLDGRDHQLNNDMSEVATGIRGLTSATPPRPA